MRFLYGLFSLLLVLFLAGCATPFPQPVDSTQVFDDGLSASSIFRDCLQAHGGDLNQKADVVRISIHGEWASMIQKIQPLVTDFGYRIDSEEVYSLADGQSEVLWTGPEGTKRVLWREAEVEVFYNGEASADPDVLQSSAMTSDAFALFHLGPSYLLWNADKPVRLSDVEESGRVYHQLYFELKPGFGFSERDEVVAFIDAETNLLYRVWVTLEGYKTTKGATVDVTFLDYAEKDGYVFPSKFKERVRAPIGIDAHHWHHTKLAVE